MNIAFEALTDEQKKKVDYLFADPHFGTDPAAFIYEIEKGQITGRTAITSHPQKKLRRAKTTEVKVTVLPVPESEITPQMIGTSNTNMDALAALVARKIYNDEIKQGDTQ